MSAGYERSLKFSEQKGIWESGLQSKNPDDCPCLKHDQAMEKKEISWSPYELGFWGERADENYS